MKKIFTLLFVAVAALAAHATDYNVPISVVVNTEEGARTVEQTGVISLVEKDGLYDLTVKNFMLDDPEAPMAVGNVELKNIKPYQDGNATLLVASDLVTFTPGDDPNVSVWTGIYLPPVKVDLRGKILNGELRCYIDIDLTETLGQVIQVAIGDGYQIANQGFEAWHTSTGEYVEPNAWHSFESATGALASLAGHHIEKSEDAHSGDASARIYATAIPLFNIVANGTMTTGRMNAGGTSATDPANHAYLDMSMNELDGNGDPFYTPLYSVPDSIAVWVKFKQGTPNADHPYATISATITDGTRYQDPEDKEYTNVVAKAQNNKIATTNGEWVRVTAPFVKTDNAVDPKAVLVTISTNADGGQGSGNDEVLVDDIEFIYNAHVTDLKIKGRSVPDLNPDGIIYEMELNEEITAADIEVTVNGKTAHVLKEVEVEDGCYVCSVVVISADMYAMELYSVRVKSNATAITTVKPAASQEATYFTLDGRQVTTLVPGRVYICRKADGTTTKVRY